MTINCTHRYNQLQHQGYPWNKIVRQMKSTSEPKTFRRIRKKVILFLLSNGFECGSVSGRGDCGVVWCVSKVLVIFFRVCRLTKYCFSFFNWCGSLLSTIHTHSRLNFSFQMINPKKCSLTSDWWSFSWWIVRFLCSYNEISLFMAVCLFHVWSSLLTIPEKSDTTLEFLAMRVFLYDF